MGLYKTTKLNLTKKKNMTKELYMLLEDSTLSKCKFFLNGFINLNAISVFWKLVNLRTNVRLAKKNLKNKSNEDGIPVKY